MAEKLSEFWPKAYENNINRLIPMMAGALANDIISVNGVKTVSPNKNRRETLKNYPPLPIAR